MGEKNCADVSAEGGVERGNRESKIIDDLLSLVKMDKSEAELNISQSNIYTLVEQILKRLRPIANKQKVELIFESIREVTADVDEMKLSLAITNLVENAIKYNKEDGWVRVTLDADHKFFYIKVSDSGIGIPEEAQDRIFERFYRVATVCFSFVWLFPFCTLSVFFSIIEFVLFM